MRGQDMSIDRWYREMGPFLDEMFELARGLLAFKGFWPQHGHQNLFVLLLTAVMLQGVWVWMFI